jgi:hypothetical protein
MSSSYYKYAVIILVAGLGGGVLGLYRGASPIVSIGNERLKENDQNPKSLSYALAKLAPAPPLPAGNSLAEIENWIDRLPRKGSSEQRIQHLLSKSPLEIKLARLLIAYNHTGDLAGVQALISSYTEEFQAKSDEVMDLINRAYFEHSISDCIIERQSMLLLASKLPGKSKPLEELVVKEMKAPHDSHTSYLLPYAQEVLITMANDPEIIRTSTLHAVAAQGTDQMTRHALATNFVKKYPKYRAKFLEDVATKGISLEDPAD